VRLAIAFFHYIPIAPQHLRVRDSNTVYSLAVWRTGAPTGFGVCLAINVTDAR